MGVKIHNRMPVAFMYQVEGKLLPMHLFQEWLTTMRFSFDSELQCRMQIIDFLQLSLHIFLLISQRISSIYLENSATLPHYHIY